MPNKRHSLPQLRKETASPKVPPHCEWLFRQDEVPDEELVACTCWEYLREVPPSSLDSAGLQGYARRLLFGYRSHTAQRKFNDSFNRTPLNVLFYFARDAGEISELLPWQKLEKNLRSKLKRSVPPGWDPLISMDVAAERWTSWRLEMPEPGRLQVPRPWVDSARELIAFGVAKEARRVLSESLENSLGTTTAIPSSPKPPKFDGSINDFSVHDPRSWLIPYAANDLASPAPFLINWGEYTVDELVAAFRQWAMKARPAFTPIARGKGTRLTGLRGALRNLGALRIMKAMTASEFMRRHDHEYHLFQQPWGSKKDSGKIPHVDLEKGRRRASKFFQKYFAADAGMKPRSWQEPRTRGRKSAV